MSIDTVVDRLEPITLAALNERAQLLRRVDTKYVADETLVAGLVADLADQYWALEIDGCRSFRYLSEYLDTFDYATYRAHLQGRRRRFKCRVRHYLDSGDRLLEVKAKGSRGETVKYRTDYHPARAGQLAFIDTCLADLYGTHVEGELAPVLEVSYQRTTLVSRTGQERVTLDRALAFRDVATGRSHHADARTWIIETKSEAGRGEPDRWLRNAHVRAQDVSKYIVGLSLTRPELRANRYLSVVRQLESNGLVAAVA